MCYFISILYLGYLNWTSTGLQDVKYFSEKRFKKTFKTIFLSIIGRFKV